MFHSTTKLEKNIFAADMLSCENLNRCLKEKDDMMILKEIFSELKNFNRRNLPKKCIEMLLLNEGKNSQHLPI